MSESEQFLMEPRIESQLTELGNEFTLTESFLYKSSTKNEQPDRDFSLQNEVSYHNYIIRIYCPHLVERLKIGLFPPNTEA